MRNLLDISVCSLHSVCAMRVSFFLEVHIICAVYVLGSTSKNEVVTTRIVFAIELSNFIDSQNDTRV